MKYDTALLCARNIFGAKLTSYSTRYVYNATAT